MRSPHRPRTGSSPYGVALFGHRVRTVGAALVAARPKSRLSRNLGSHKGCPYESVIIGCPKRATPIPLSYDELLRRIALARAGENCKVFITACQLTRYSEAVASPKIALNRFAVALLPLGPAT